MVSRIRKTLTVQQRNAAFEHTNHVAATAAADEARTRDEKTARLRQMRMEARKKALEDEGAA